MYREIDESRGSESYVDVLDGNDFSASEKWQNLNVPKDHDADPFACPCCANVFEQLLTQTNTNLVDHGKRLKKVPRVVGGTAYVFNAAIQTMNTALPAADAMLVEDGKIVWIGQAQERPEKLIEDLKAGDNEFLEIDIQGKTVLPGFIDPHMHLAPLAMLHSFENVGPFRFGVTQDALDHLANLANDLPAGEWIVGRQFDPSLQEGPGYLTRQMLDTVSTEHPIFIYNASLHLAYCNSVALALGGVTAATPDPEGAELGRDEYGEPNGVLKAGPAMALVARHNPYVKNTNLAEVCLQVFAAANKLGITMLCDQGTGLFQGASELELYKAIRDSNRMSVRFRYSLAHSREKQWDALGVEWGSGDEWVRLTGWKVVTDGSNQGRTGLQREAFVGGDSKGIAYIEVDELNTTIEQRLRNGWAICVHANGDAAIDRVLDAFERAQKLGLNPSAMRCRIEHCSILHDEQIERIARLGLSPSFLIGHVYYWGKAFSEDIFGLEKAAKLDRTGACEAKGIRWTIHSDDPVTEMNPLRCIENAVTRNMWRTDEQLSAEECISVEAGLRAMTIDAAWQCHSDDEVGSLEVDKFADFVVLDADPRTVPTDSISKISVLETWVNGRQVFAA